MDGRTDRHIGRQTGRQTDRQTIDNVPIQDLSNNWSKIDAESEICQTHPKVPLTSREDQAWSLIRDLSVESLLCGHLPSITRNVSPSLKSLFQDCCDLALTRIVQDPTDEAGWKLFLCIPRMILRHKRGGAAAIRQERHKFLSFLDFQWEELLHLQRPLLTSSSMQSKLSTNRKKVLQLIKCGELSRAAKLLLSPGLAPVSAETVVKLSLKHPARVKSVPCPEVLPQSTSLSESLFFSTLSKLPKSSGSGPSGWNFDHFKALASRSTTARKFFTVCNLIASGSIPQGIVELLSASRLVALSKPSGDVRPIAVGECIRRLTAKTLCLQKKESFSSFLSPLQHGLAVEGGPKLIVHHISLLLESNPDWVILKTDLKNAFNSVSQSHLLPEVAKAFPDIYQHVHQMYAGFSPLVFNDGKIAHILRSEEGIHQGDPLGPMLFSVALHPFLLGLQKNHSSTRVLAYLDDMFFYWANGGCFIMLERCGV